MLSALLLAVAIVAHDPGYTTSLANHIQRWLKGEQITARVMTSASMGTALRDEKLAFLVGFDRPTAVEMNLLRNFRSRGGKLVVFHSSSPQLAELMGVKPLGYQAAAYPGQWSRMKFVPGVLADAPSDIRQTSTVLHRARPIPGRASVLATWVDRAGKSTGEAAWIASSAGFWMTHVLLADGDEQQKQRLLGAMVGSVCPALWSMKGYVARENAKSSAAYTLAKQQQPRAGEIHAVWDHSGCGLYPGDWPRTIRILREAHVTDLFVNVAGAGFAHYASSVLPRSRTFADEGDQLAACLAAAKGSGIRVHAWVLCFTATRATPDRLENFRQKGWRLKTTEGKLSEYLNPANPQVRDYLLGAIDEIVTRYPVAGIHLDFVRWYERAAKPSNAAETISQFVMQARRHVKRPKWLTTAVLGKYPACVSSVGQDWPSWVEMNAVDYVVPMDYTEDKLRLTSYLAQHALSHRVASRTIVGIGVTANESRLDACQVIDQINLVRRFGLAGEALFDLDVTLEKRILPYLKIGIWK